MTSSQLALLLPSIAPAPSLQSDSLSLTMLPPESSKQAAFRAWLTSHHAGVHLAPGLRFSHGACPPPYPAYTFDWSACMQKQQYWAVL